MNYPRVNLLKKTEQRHQGAVSRRFILVSAVIAPVLLIALLSCVKLIQYSGIQSALTSSREIWKDLEPKLALYKEEKRGLIMNRSALDLFNSWNDSQTSFVELLIDVQERVPEKIQLTRLSIRSESTPSVYTTPKGMELTYDLKIEGKSYGDLAENHVIGLQKELLESEQIGRAFNSLNLVSMRRLPGEKSQNIRTFRLEGKTSDEEGL